MSSASVTITMADLDMGTETTSCTQSYSRTLDDDGIQDCDAGHILAHRLGGPGNQPINIFPQVIIQNFRSFEQLLLNKFFQNLCDNRIPLLIVVFMLSTKERSMIASKPKGPPLPLCLGPLVTVRIPALSLPL